MFDWRVAWRDGHVVYANVTRLAFAIPAAPRHKASETCLVLVVCCGSPPNIDVDVGLAADPRILDRLLSQRGRTHEARCVTSRKGGLRDVLAPAAVHSCYGPRLATSEDSARLVSSFVAVDVSVRCETMSVADSVASCARVFQGTPEKAVVMMWTSSHGY